MRIRGAAAGAIVAARLGMCSMTGPRIVRSAGDARLYDEMPIDGTVANARPAVRRETSSTIGLQIAKGVPGAEGSGRTLTGYRAGRVLSAAGPDLHPRSTSEKSWVVPSGCSAARR